MATIFCYTKPGIGVYPDDNYPGHVGYLCDWEQAMHLAWSQDGKEYHPLRNNTGILFAKAAFDEGDPKGVTKTLIDPWVFRKKDGSFGVCCIRCNQNAPDPGRQGSMLLFSSPDLVHYTEDGFLSVAEGEIRRPRCFWDISEGCYRLMWEEDGRTIGARSEDIREVSDVCACEHAPAYSEETFGIPDCVPGNVLEVTDEELCVIRGFLDEIRNVSVHVPPVKIRRGSVVSGKDLPKAICVYSDGSEHEKAVDWDGEAIQKLDTAVPGTFRIPGKVRRSPWHFPMRLEYGGMDPRDLNDANLYRGMSDPCITYYRGKYYLSSSGTDTIVLRCADRPEETFGSAPVIISHVALDPGEPFCGTWAAELHEIGGKLCMLTARCPGGDWTKVYAVVLICHGDPLESAAWSQPHEMLAMNGRRLKEDGITLDMTYFRDGGRDYVMWSDRRITMQDGKQVIEPADIRIAVIDPEKPWQLISPITCVIRPDYGWDRMETEVDEDPYILRHGDDLMITFSGSSTGMADLYDVGLLKAKSGSDLLDPAAWEEIGYPLLTKESVPGEYGPGHNNFVVDHESGDTVMVYHAVPHDQNGKTLYRQPGLRRLHWTKNGLPYLEMTQERDLDPKLEQVEVQVTID